MILRCAPVRVGSTAIGIALFSTVAIGAPDRPTSESIVSIEGRTTGEALGNSVAAGDFDGDGFGDLAVGAQFAGSIGAGQVHVHFGPDGSRSATVEGEVAGDQFGFSIGNAGDVNGDGVDDLVVGANLNDAGGPNAGRAYVYSIATDELLYTFTGHTAPSEFGWSVNGAGDFNKDGFDDVIIGALTSSVGAAHGGSAYVHSGKDGSVLMSFHASQPEELMGWRVTAAGDINIDGFDDVAVSSPRFDGDEIDVGRISIYSGITGNLLRTIEGESFDDVLGFGLACIGDANRDGFPDIAAGSAFNSDAGMHAGRVVIFSGATGTELVSFYGEAPGDKFGASVAYGGDLDGDLFPDIIVGAPGNDADPDSPIDHTGRVYSISILRNEVLSTVTGTGETDWLGWSCAGGADFNRDGLDDLFLGAPLASRDLPLVGAAHVLLTKDERAGCISDLNGDGLVNGADLAALLSAWGTSGGDLTGDTRTNGADLAHLLGAWGSDCGL
jgi:hypothetical protein